MLVRVEIEDRTFRLEGDDVAVWAAAHTGVDAVDEAELELHASAYVTSNPRPEPDAQGGRNVASRQRMALLRRLAAGPATRRELLAAMRGAAGYVGADDWRNRMDELRGHGKRGGGHVPLPIVHDADTGTYRLSESFPTLGRSQRDLIGALKARLADGDDDLSPTRRLLDDLFPDIPAAVVTAGAGGVEGDYGSSSRSSPWSAAHSSRSQASSPRSDDDSRR